MKRRRDNRYSKRFYELIDMYGRVCFYCREEVSTTIDHVVPVAWGQDDETENLVPPILNAVKEYATIGEICNVLREIYGEHKQLTIF